MSGWIPVSDYYKEEEPSEEDLQRAFDEVFVPEDRQALQETYFAVRCMCGRRLSGKGQFALCWTCRRKGAREDHELEEHDQAAIKRAKDRYDNEFKKSDGSQKSWSEIFGGTFASRSATGYDGAGEEGGEGVSDSLYSD